MRAPSMLTGLVAPLSSIARQERRVEQKQWDESVVIALGVGAAAYWWMGESATWTVALGGAVLFYFLYSGMLGNGPVGSDVISYLPSAIFVRGTAADEESIRRGALYSNYWDIVAGGNTVRT